MYVFAKFDEIPSMILQDTRLGTHTRSDGCSVGWTDVKTVYPSTNTVCGGGGGGIITYEPHHEKTNILVSCQV